MHKKLSCQILIEHFMVFLKILQYSEENACVEVFFFNKVAGLQLSSEYCKIFKNSFFHKTPSVTASEKFISFPGQHQ